MFLFFPVQILQAVDTDSILAGQYLDRAQYLYEVDQYDSLVWYYSEAYFFFHSSDPIRASQCLLGLAEHYRISGDFDSVRAYFDKYTIYAEGNKIENPFLLAEYFYIRGKLSRDIGDIRSALTEISKATKIIENRPDRGNKLARYLNMLGTVYGRMNDIDSAEIMYNLSFMEIQSSDQDLAIENSWYYENIGKIYELKGEYDKVLDNYFESIEIKKKIHGENSPEIVRIYLNVASFYILMAQPDSADKYLGEAQQLIEVNPVASRNYSRRLFTYRGTMQYYAGNYILALHEYRTALQSAISSLGKDNGWLYAYYNNIGSCEYVLENYQEALFSYSEGLKLASLLHPSEQVLTYHYLARTYAKLGNIKRATEYYNRLITSRQKYYGENDVLLAADKEAYGGYLYDLDQVEAAIQQYQDALEIRKRHFGIKHHLTSQVLLTVGELYVNENQPDSALKYLQLALIAASGSFDLIDISSNPDLSEINYHLEVLKTLKLKASALDQLSDMDTLSVDKISLLSNSVECLELAVEVIHYMNSSWISEESRLYLSDHERETFLSLVDILLKIYTYTSDDQYLSRAYRAVEQIKYATLLSLIEDQNALQVGNVPIGLQTRERELKDQISLYKDLIHEEIQTGNPDSLKMLTWNERLYDYSNQRKDLIRSIERRYPDYYQLKYDNNALDADDVQRKIREDEVLIEYLLRDTLLQVFIIDPSGIRYNHIGLTEDFYSDLQMVLDYIKLDYYKNSDGPAPEFCSAANRLYNILFKEINIEPERNIIIIPDGMLAYLPFDVLLTGKVSAQDFSFKELPYLLKSNPVRYAYSATLMFQTKHWVNRARNNLIAFAPSAVNSDSILHASSVRETSVNRKDIKPLRYAETEVRSIKNIIGGDLMLGPDANEAAFKELAYRYRVLHLAMHAFIDDEDPLYTKLVFAEDSLEEQDGFLNVYEIYGLNLNAKMVVLSGCNSGSGISQQGEGIMSLARAFFYCGVPNIVMTLWTVNDESAELLMTEFYKDLAKGRTTGTALRNAKLNFIESAEPIHQHPYFWSGFVMVGDNEAVFKPRAAKFLFLGLLFVIAILGIIYKNRLSKRKGLEKEGLQAF